MSKGTKQMRVGVLLRMIEKLEERAEHMSEVAARNVGDAFLAGQICELLGIISGLKTLTGIVTEEVKTETLAKMVLNSEYGKSAAGYVDTDSEPSKGWGVKKEGGFPI